MIKGHFGQNFFKKWGNFGQDYKLINSFPSFILRGYCCLNVKRSKPKKSVIYVF